MLDDLIEPSCRGRGTPHETSHHTDYIGPFRCDLPIQSNGISIPTNECAMIENAAQICQICGAIKLWVLRSRRQRPVQNHHKSISALKTSALTCPSCNVLLRAVANPHRIPAESPLELHYFMYDDPPSRLQLHARYSTDGSISDTHMIGKICIYADEGRHCPYLN